MENYKTISLKAKLMDVRIKIVPNLKVIGCKWFKFRNEYVKKALKK